MQLCKYAKKICSHVNRTPYFQTFQTDPGLAGPLFHPIGGRGGSTTQKPQVSPKKRPFQWEVGGIQYTVTRSVEAIK